MQKTRCAADWLLSLIVQVLPTGTGGHDAFTGLLKSRTYQALRRRALDEMSGQSLFIDIEAGPEIWSRSRDPALRQRARELAA